MDTVSSTTLPAKRGVGRPKGVVPDAVKAVHKQRQLFNQRASRMATKLLNAQAIIALGTHHLVTKTIDDEGKVHINIVRDEKRQQTLLDEGEYGKDYLILEGTPGDWRAADAILNRAWGKPKETMEVETNITVTLKALHVHVLDPSLPQPAQPAPLLESNIVDDEIEQ